MTRRHYSAGFLLACFASASVPLAACSESFVDENASPAIGSEERPVTSGAVIEPVIEAGCRDCSGPELLVRAQHIAALEAGFVVVDRVAPFVRVFRRDGTLASSFGTEGQAPDSLAMPLWAFPVSEEGVMVYDGMPSRLVFYDATGRHERTISTPQRIPLSAAAHPDGSAFYVLGTTPEDPSGIQLTTWDLLTDERSSRLLPAESIPVDWRGQPEQQFSLAVSPVGGYTTGDRWNYVIRTFELDGTPISSFGRSLTRRVLSEDEVEQALERAAALTRQLGMLDPEVPTESPHFDHAAFDYDDRGRLWVQTTRGGRQTTVFDVFEDDGSYAGELVVGRRVKDLRTRAGKSFDVDAGWLGAIVLNDLDEETIALWELDEDLVQH